MALHISSKRSKAHRSSFVAPSNRLAIVPDALSWREGAGGVVAPKGPAGWAAATVSASGRTLVDAGPYGIIDLAAQEPRDEVPQLGVVWWDKRSLRDEDDDVATIQTSFVPAPTTSHVSLAPEPMAPPSPVPSPVREQLIPPIPASRPTAPADVPPRTRHARRSRHVVLLPKARGVRRPVADHPHPRRARLRRRRTRRRVAIGLTLVVASFIVTVIIQTVVVTPFTVPSSSMKHTLHPGDRIAVNRLAYAYSAIQRGDVIVFSDPGGWLEGGADAPSGDFLVKRVVGVPGDRVACCSTNGRLTINGRELSEPYAVVAGADAPAATPFDVTVPAGALWVLGDNRPVSRDSSRTQDLPSKGFVPIADVVGQAVLTIWPLDHVAPIGSARATFDGIPDSICPI